MKPSLTTFIFSLRKPTEVCRSTSKASNMFVPTKQNGAGKNKFNPVGDDNKNMYNWKIQNSDLTLCVLWFTTVDYPFPPPNPTTTLIGLTLCPFNPPSTLIYFIPPPLTL